MAKTVYDLIREEVGVDVFTKRNPVISSIGTTAGQFLRANPNRVGFLIINLSANTLYVLNDITPSSTNGIRLAPNGGTLTSIWKEDYTLVSESWSVVATGAGSNILVIELLTQPVQEPS